MSKHVEVTGQGTHHVVPDLVIVRARVQCDAADVAGALDQTSTRTGTALQAAADHGVDARDRRTHDVGISPRRTSTAGVVGYTAYQALQLTVRDPGRVGALLQPSRRGRRRAVRRRDRDGRGAQPRRRRSGARGGFADAKSRAVQYATLADAISVRWSPSGRVGSRLRPRPMMSRSADAFATSMPGRGAPMP